MDLVIRIAGEHHPDELSRLARALRESDAVTGKITLARERPMAEDRLGSLVDVLSVAVGAGGTITASVQVLARYLLRRGPDLNLEVSRGPDGARSIKMSAKKLRVMSPTDLEQTIRQVIDALDAPRQRPEDHG